MLKAKVMELVMELVMTNSAKVTESFCWRLPCDGRKVFYPCENEVWCLCNGDKA
jgi:hypothetical protein